MNAKLFKQLIKEAVKEAVREELRQVLAEHAMSQLTQHPINENFSFTTDNTDVTRPNVKSQMDQMFGNKTRSIPSSSNLKVQPNTENPFLDFLKDTAQNLSAQDISGLRNLES